MSSQRILVIGAGVVGVCCALHLRRAGHLVTLVDPDEPGSQTSHGNAGGFAVGEIIPLSIPGLLWKVPGWLLDPLGPLAIRPAYLPALLPFLWRFLRAGNQQQMSAQIAALAALMGSIHDDYDPLLIAAGVTDLVVKVGGLVVYESSEAMQQDAWQWGLKRRYGVKVEEVDAGQIHDLEPALGPQLSCGYFLPDWRHTLDPRRIVTALAELFEREGGQILRDRVLDFDRRDATPCAALTAEGMRLGFEQVVVAAGVWSRALAKKLGYSVPLESERGYNTTIAEPGITVHREVMFAQRKFVMTPMRMGLRIGGAAEFAGLAAPPNYSRAQALVELARRYLPGLRSVTGTQWMGHRPTLPDSLPVIGRSPTNDNVLFAFGHSHLGLTQGATTGRLIADLADHRPATIDLAPFRIDRF